MSTKLVSSSIVTLVLGLGLMAPLNGGALEAGQQANPDNTGVNKRDQKSNQPTADQGKNNTPDRELARQIRRDVVKDKSLSVYGHNVKIIAQGGKVTLRGPVHTDDEKSKIADYAQKHAGSGNVVNELEVKNSGK